MSPRTGSQAELDRLAAQAARCTNCDLYERATQVVFGEGPASSRVVMVGEQPGDKEDEEGEPFVGPAGRLLHRAMREAGIDESSVYLTNAVKHFKWEPRGKRRLHKTPNQIEIVACQPWLAAELQVIQPELVVALGAIAARALTGSKTRVTRDRGTVLQPPGEAPVLVTVHPSSVLRSDQREAAFASLVDDLRVVDRYLADHGGRVTRGARPRR
ncbi:MAG: UdgX family uracil-DNA binding protein [Acidimicrobiales bacterium]